MISLRISRYFKNAVSAMALVLIGCNPGNDLEFPSYQNYFPLRIGDYRVYQVNETLVTAYNIETNFNYEIKTLVTDSFQNSEGGYSYIISRFKRINSNEPWSGLDTRTARANEKEVVVLEDNIPYVRLSFPVQINRSWNGNAYNHEESIEFCADISRACDLYSFGSTGFGYETLNGLIFGNSIEVIENDDPDIFTRKDIRKTIYAFDVGIVYNESTILNYCTFPTDCYAKQLVESGRIFNMELIEYGRE